jgi:predicted RNA binding protein YcfA (HicA-like mRNA interferase family)
MSKEKGVFSGKFVVAILTRKCGFSFVSQHGSHIKLRRGVRTTIVPLHKELAPGTLKSVLHLAGISKEDFFRIARERKAR